MHLPFVEHVGARIVESSPGASLLTLAIAPFHLNSNGVVHGGVPFTLADTGMGAALFPMLGPGERCATIEIKISYFRPVLQGDLHCRSRVVHRGGRTASLESTLHDGEGTLVGMATGTFAVIAARPVPIGSAP